MSCKLFRSLELLQNNGKRNFLYVIYATSRIPRLRWGQPLLAEVGPFFGERVRPRKNRPGTLSLGFGPRA